MIVTLFKLNKKLALAGPDIPAKSDEAYCKSIKLCSIL